MNCPVCKTAALVMSDRQGIEIDYCPQCRGVWLDRGELDKIIERSIPTAPPRTEVRPQAQPYPPQAQPYPPRYEGEYYKEGHGYHKKKHKSFLGEIFDFD